MTRSGSTSIPELQQVLLAKNINAVLGGPIVAPWEVNELPDTTIEAILSILRTPAIQHQRAEVEHTLANWRNAHPHYRK